ncbi:hypothetical protein MGMO_39c00020 [Methyloglobulus morosus KoM1]|uniref:Uncharacterized protein n=1 Tax=Methyloglobulus morosus KoM1 TaxID=1116472 RepID=V5C8F0_9GAMM|nr:hypothetical protein [Methyloglobulus morosus]ESS73003.1 hypothetical protein MGMO_39c00020 [Methyloglobulus morosus KoM1]
MNRNPTLAENLLLLRAAVMWLLMALCLAWCLVFLKFDLAFIKMIFPGKFTRVLQAHLDFLLMTALLFGFYAVKVPLPATVRWCMVIGAFTNSSLFMAQAIFPILDSQTPPEGLFPSIFRLYLMASLLITSYGFGRGAVIVLLSTFKALPDDHDG